MATPVTMPMLGLTMEEGTVATWLKREGETVAKEEPLLMVEMDKGTMEVPAPASGRLARILVQQGQTVPVKTLIAEIEAATGEPAPPPAPTVPPDTGAAPTREQVETASVERTDAPSASASAPARTPTPTPAAGVLADGASDGARQFVSPRARMRARELDVDLARLRGSGPHGRVVESDVLQASQAAVAEPQRVAITPLARRLAQEHGVSLDDVQGTGPGGRVTQDDVLRAAERGPKAPASAPAPVPAVAATSHGVQPLTRIRRITAERMAASARSVAGVTLHLEVDLSEAARFRQQLAPEFARLGTAKLPWDALIAKAAALALTEHPALNAQWVEGAGIRRNTGVSVGVAVALEPEGLVVPVLRGADTRSLRDLASDLLGLADKARASRLGLDEMQGGSFTITNLGAYGVGGFTPIVNPPEAAILGVGRIGEKPAVVDGRVEVRTMCTLSLTFDHRIVDGAPAAAFLARLGELLERPYTLLGI